MSDLMDIILDCENRLGWSPPAGAVLWRARAGEHRKLTRAMEKRGYTVEDLRTALAYCLRRRQAITSPMELIGLVDKARDLTPDTDPRVPLDDQIDAAVAWEAANRDGSSANWGSRLVRVAGHLRADVLQEWRDAGRG